MTKFEDEDKPRRVRHEDSIDHSKSCCYERYGEKCQRLGTIAHGTKGEGPWFCADHFYGRDLSPRAAEKDWQDATIDALIQPQDYRQPHENRTAYRRRKMAEIRASLLMVGQRLPYNKNSRLELDEERVAIQDEQA